MFNNLVKDKLSLSSIPTNNKFVSSNDLSITSCSTFASSIILSLSKKIFIDLRLKRQKITQKNITNKLKNLYFQKNRINVIYVGLFIYKNT